MRFSINLRGDLAKLSDAELADRLQAAWAAYNAADKRLNRLALWYSRRGPIRHPWVYRLLSIAGVSGAEGFTLAWDLSFALMRTINISIFARYET